MPLKRIYLIQPFGVGKDKKSTAMIWPSAILKDSKFNLENMLFILRIDGPNSFHLRIINEKELLNEHMMSAQKFTRLPEQTPSAI
jgi:hypothetical protein